MQQTRTYNVFRAFGFAFAGLKYFLRHERNGRIQALIAVITVLFGIVLHIDRAEWIVILLCIGAVLSAEMINSALEKLCDYIQPSFHTQIKIIKDVAAGAVLFVSAISAIIGSIIFLPKLWLLF